MCQYLSRFCQNLSQTVLPLRDLTRDDTEFLWSDVHETAFNSSKTLIASTTALRYYDVSLPVTLQVDASESAIGGVLLQDGHPVCFPSHILSATEKNYAQIEKECLAIVSCMEKWHHCLYGKQDITIHSDHQPLETIFKKPLSRAPRKLQRMMLRLQNYHFTVQYKKGKELFVVDTLSRAALGDGSGMTQEYDVFRVDLTQTVTKPCQTGHNESDQRADCETPILNDTEKSGACRLALPKGEVPNEIRAYWDFGDEISVYDGVLFKSHQVKVPGSLRSELLQKIHKAHQGADSSIRRARESVYWPGMQAAIRQTRFWFGVCSQYLTERPQEPIQSHAIPSLPWERVSADLFQLDGSNFLVLVDHYSDYFEFDPLRNTPMEKRNLQSRLRKIFSRNLALRTLTWLIWPIETRYNRDTNTHQHSDSCLLNPEMSFQQQWASFYRKPHQIVMRNIEERRARSKAHYDKRASGQLKPFTPGEKVFVKPRPTNKSQPWMHGEVVEQPTSRSCLVKTAVGPVRRNHVQIRGARTEPAERKAIEMDQLEVASRHSEQEQERQPANPEQMELQSGPSRADECALRRSHKELESAAPRADECGLRRSQRIRKLPSRFRDYVM